MRNKQQNFMQVVFIGIGFIVMAYNSSITESFDTSNFQEQEPDKYEESENYGIIEIISQKYKVSNICQNLAIG